MPWMNRSSRNGKQTAELDPPSAQSQADKKTPLTPPPSPPSSSRLSDPTDPYAYRPVPLSTPDSALPTIDASVVARSASPSCSCPRHPGLSEKGPNTVSSPGPEPEPEEEGQPGLLWLVIDGLVYDCTLFAAEHPGGRAVLEAFRGRECGWQFWRFHGAETLRRYGRPLRVGRTDGVRNGFVEPPRFVGLRGLGGDEW